MDVILAVRLYFDQMIKDSGVGMKALLMDKETTTMIALVYAQSEVFQKEVYLFESLDSRAREPMKHLNAIVFVRPTRANVESLARELQAPNYNSYFIYFSYFLEDKGMENALSTLAKADEHEVVKEIKEFYADFYALTNNVFTFNLTPASSHTGHWDAHHLSRVTDGLASVLLALKKKPVIRYVAQSRMAEDLARGVAAVYKDHPRQFAFRQPDNPPLLLILDRHNDPITPLLHQWTYHAMIHELIGMSNNRVDLSNAPGIKADLKEVVLSTEQDEFFKKSMYLNFGEVGVAIKELLEEYQAKAKSHEQIESIADMKAFVENYPQFRKLSGATSKHVAVASELSRLVSDYNLLSVSELEQDIVTANEKSQSSRVSE